MVPRRISVSWKQPSPHDNMNYFTMVIDWLPEHRKWKWLRKDTVICYIVIILMVVLLVMERNTDLPKPGIRADMIKDVRSSMNYKSYTLINNTNFHFLVASETCIGIPKIHIVTLVNSALQNKEG